MPKTAKCALAGLTSLTLAGIVAALTPPSQIPDPYAWLEEQSDETEQFVQAQQAFTEAYLAKDEDNRAVYRETLRDLFNYARFSAPSLKGDGLCGLADPAHLTDAATTPRTTAACKLSRRSTGYARAARARSRMRAPRASSSSTRTSSVVLSWSRLSSVALERWHGRAVVDALQQVGQVLGVRRLAIGFRLVDVRLASVLPC